MEKTILRNGMTLVIDKRPIKSVAIVINVKVGSVNDPAKKEGISHLIEHMLFAGTKNRTREQLNKDVAGLGGIINGASSTEKCFYSIQVLNKHFDTALDIIADLVQNPLFNNKELKKEKKIISEEINMAKDDMEDYSDELFRKTLFKKHPARNPIMGTKKSIKGVTIKEIVEFYRQYYIPNNMIISITGSINYTKVKSKVEKVFMSFKPRKLSERKKFEESVQTKEREKVEKKKIESSYIRLGFKTAKGGEKDTYVLDVIEALLLKPGTLAGRLASEIRNKRGLSYDIDIDNIASCTYGYFTICTSTHKKNLNDVKQIILKELKLKNLTKNEIEDAKAFIEGFYTLYHEDSEEWACELGYREVINDLNTMEGYIRKIKKVTKKDILRVARKYFKNHTLVIVQQK